MFSILRSVGSAACSFLNSHLSAKQLFSIHLCNSFVHVGSVLEGNESVPLTASKSFRQTDFGTAQSLSVSTCIQIFGKGNYIFIPANASLKSCSELLYARLPTHTRLVFAADASACPSVCVFPVAAIFSS